MIKQLSTLKRNQIGSAAIEFVIAAPVLLLMIFGLIEMAIFLYARVGLQEAVEAGARYATIYPSPSDSQIIAKVNSAKFGLDPAKVTGPTIEHGTYNGVKYVDVTMNYSTRVDFVFFDGPTINLTRTRRAYQP